MAEIKLLSPEFQETVSLLTSFQKRFNQCLNEAEKRNLITELNGIAGKYIGCSVAEQQAIDALLPPGAKTDRVNYSIPMPVRFVWEGGEENGILELSQDPDFQKSKAYPVSDYHADIYNLEIARHYYWRVNGSATGEFFTQDEYPRWINADNIYNVRDIGGYLCRDGKRVKQGLVYRGIRLEDTITEKGKNYLRELGIKTEIDLRSEVKLESSPLGEDIVFKHLICSAYDEFIYRDPPEDIRELMEMFAEESNYPIYYHCYGGADRTEMVTFMLGAILGLDDKTLLHEYEQTLIAALNPDMRRSRWGELFHRFVEAMDRPEFGEGELSERSLVFLQKRVGLSEETIQKIRSNLLEV